MEGKPHKQSNRSSLVARGALAAAVLALGTWGVLAWMSRVPTTILVAGKPIATLETGSAAKAVLARLRCDNMGDVQITATRFSQPVTMRRADDGAEFMDVPEAVKALGSAVSLEVQAYAILVGDQPVAALPNEHDADKALKILKDHYASKLERLYAEPSFKERVTVERRYVDSGIVRSDSESVAKMLRTVVGEAKTHTIQRGDRAVHLARQYDVALTHLKRLNPGVNLERLVEGDKLVVSIPTTPITVITRGLVTKTVNVSGPSGMGSRTGKREVKTVMTFENDTPVTSDVISQVTVWDKPTGQRRSYSDGNTSGTRRYRSYRRTSYSRPRTSSASSGTNTRATSGSTRQSSPSSGSTGESSSGSGSSGGTTSGTGVE